MKALTQIFFFLITCCWFQGAFGQLDNHPLADEIKVLDSDSNSWGINLTNFNYFRNTEYFNDIEVGRTLFGTQLNPSLFIQPSANFKIQAGIFLQSDFGATPSINKVLPTFSLKWKRNNSSIIFGTLEGALAHRMYEPMFDINTAIERRVENGFQFKNESKLGFYDVWINWEQFIERGSPFKEQFTAGLNATTTLFETDKGLRLSAPLQGTAFHRGGQIDADTSNLVMVFNGAAGFALEQQLQSKRIKRLKVDLMTMSYYENSSSGYFPFKNGMGFMGNFTAELKNLTIMLSYWNANQYIAPRGSAIYQSVSKDTEGYYQQRRELLFLRFLYQKELAPNLHISARFEPFLDLGNTQMDYCYSLYLIYHLDSYLGKLKAKF